MADATTRQRWTDFVPYHTAQRGARIVPVRFLGAAHWRTVQGTTGYYIDDPTRPYRFYPVEFNFLRVCWVEVTWNPIDQRWDHVRPLGPQYQCEIRDPPPPLTEWGRVDGEEEESSESNEETSEDEDQPRSTEAEVSRAPTDPIITELAAAAESI